MMIKKEHDNYIKQSLDDVLKSKPPNLYGPLLTCMPNPTWDNTQHDSLAKLLQVSSISQEELTVLLGPWHRAIKLAELWGGIKSSEAKKRLRFHLKQIKQLKKEINANHFGISSLMELLLGNEVHFHLEALEELLGSIIAINPKRGQPYNADYFIRYAINSLFYIGKEIGLKSDRSPSSIHKFIQCVTGRDQDIINTDYDDYKNTCNYRLALISEIETDKPLEKNKLYLGVEDYKLIYKFIRGTNKSETSVKEINGEILLENLIDVIPADRLAGLNNDSLNSFLAIEEQIINITSSRGHSPHRASNFLKYFSRITNPAIQFIYDARHQNTQKILRSIRLRRSV